MKSEELILVLHKLSLLAISEITSKTVNYDEFDNSLLSYGRCRVITEPLQLISIKQAGSDQEGHQITFQFSPSYLTQYYNFCLKAGFCELKWVVMLDKRVAGVVDSVANSRIEFEFISSKLEDVSTQEFLESIKNLS